MNMFWRNTSLLFLEAKTKVSVARLKVSVAPLSFNAHELSVHCYYFSTAPHLLTFK